MQGDPNTDAMDPIALTLAVWLGVIVGVTGLVRLSENAAAQSALSQAGTSEATVLQPGVWATEPGAKAFGRTTASRRVDVDPFETRLMAFGG